MVQTGYFGLDGGAMFGVVPKPLWEKSFPSDNRNRITLGTRMPVLRNGSRIVIIDTGIGGNWDEKFAERFVVDHSEYDLFPGLAQIDIRPEDVTDVILTHLHFDHTGGSVIKENGKWVPAFPNATYHIHQKQFDWAKDASPKDRGSFETNRFIPLAKEGVVNFITSDFKLDDEINIIETNGHTFGHLLVEFEDNANSFLFCSDLIPTAAHVNVPFIMGFDLQPLLTIEEKNKFLKRMFDKNGKLLFQHDPEFLGTTLKSTEKGIVARTIYNNLKDLFR